MTNQTETKRTPTIAASLVTFGSPGHEYAGLVLEFSNGRTLRLDPKSTTDDIRDTAMLHGFKQKLVDAAAISRDPETGRPATVEDKYQAVKTVFDRLLAGEWNAPREGGGSGGLLFRAMCQMHPAKAPEALREWLDKKTDAEKAALRKNPKVAAIIAELQLATGKAANVDTDALLDELNDE